MRPALAAAVTGTGDEKAKGQMVAVGGERVSGSLVGCERGA
jgi:hypothetical protein